MWHCLVCQVCPYLNTPCTAGAESGCPSLLVCQHACIACLCLTHSPVCVCPVGLWPVTFVSACVGTMPLDQPGWVLTRMSLCLWLVMPICLYAKWIYPCPTYPACVLSGLWMALCVWQHFSLAPESALPLCLWETAVARSSCPDVCLTLSLCPRLAVSLWPGGCVSGLALSG